MLNSPNDPEMTVFLCYDINDKLMILGTYKNKACSVKTTHQKLELYIISLYTHE